MFAAASLKNALDAVAAGFTQASGTQVALSYGATSTLARQIENGAPADVFVSADEDWMDYLEQRQALKAASRRGIVGNALVLIAPTGAAARLTVTPGLDWLALLGPGGRLAIADPRAVPAGKYARAALEKLGAWAALEPRLVRTENVRVALQFVARAEVPFGIVYASDQHAEQRTLTVATFDAGLHPRIVYPAAVIATSRHAKSGDFVETLQSGKARDIFLSLGFQPLPSWNKAAPE